MRIIHRDNIFFLKTLLLRKSLYGKFASQKEPVLRKVK